jgi:hypothetical protein
VTFTVRDGNGNPVGSAVSANVSNGLASAAFVLPAGTPLGAYTITASYTDVSPGNFNPSTGTGTLNVSRDQTSVSVSNVTVPYTSGDPNITLSATVTGPEGILVSEGQVQFVLTTLSGSQLGQKVTANFNNGQFSTSFMVPPATPLGPYNITASYTDGSSGNFSPSSGTGTLTVVTSTTTVSVNNVNIVYSLFGEQEKLTAVVYNALGQTVDEGFVTFSDSGQTVTVPIVNSLATATLNIPLFAENPFAHPMAVGYSNITNNFFASTGVFTIEQTLMDFLMQIMALELLLQSASANA